MGAILLVTTDSELIHRSREDPQAFAVLYDKYCRSVHRYAATRAGESVADDVMAQTFLVAFESRESFDHQWEDARPWLFGIATNLLRRHHRTEARRLEAFAKAAGRDSYGVEVLGGELFHPVTCHPALSRLGALGAPSAPTRRTPPALGRDPPAGVAVVYLASSTSTRSRPLVSGVKNVVANEIAARTSE